MSFDPSLFQKQLSKEKLRAHFKRLRDSLPPSKPNLSALLPRFNAHKLILSYVSLGSERDTSEINEVLAAQKKLVLPKTVGDTLQLFHVEHLSSQLLQNKWGIWEPNPLLCPQIAYPQISLALIPALAFDKNNHRLGYGKGYYDRLLKECPSAWTIGIGYPEQLSNTLLPTTRHDIPLKELIL